MALRFRPSVYRSWRRSATAIRRRRMTLEAIDAHAGIAMASGTELPRCIDRDGAASRVNGHVTVDALVETVPLSPHPCVHGFITLMHQKNHVVTPYYGCWLHTLRPLSLWD
jgi:hypothetical protein